MLPKSLNLVEAKRPLKDSPANSRRARLLRQIDNQIAFSQNPSGSGMPDRKCWWWIDSDGKYLLAIKYGRKPVELAKGKFAIKCAAVSDIKTALEKVREAVASGEFDPVLANLANEIRAKFKNRTS